MARLTVRYRERTRKMRETGKKANVITSAPVTDLSRIIEALTIPPDEMEKIRAIVLKNIRRIGQREAKYKASVSR